MLSTAATVNTGVDGWRWHDGTGRALTFDKLVCETKEAHDIRQNVQVRDTASLHGRSCSLLPSLRHPLCVPPLRSTLVAIPQ